MKLFLHELRTEQVLYWRNREAAFFTFFLPVIFFLVFGSIYGDSEITKEHLRAAPFLEAGMIGYGLASTAFAGLAITMVIRRESGVLKRIRATPLPRTTYIGAVLTSTFITFLIEAVVLIVLGRLLFSVGLPQRPLSLLATLVLGAASFAALGLALTRRDGAPPPYLVGAGLARDRARLGRDRHYCRNSRLSVAAAGGVRNPGRPGRGRI
jgi:ABC-2 type transport system permease protein